MARIWNRVNQRDKHRYWFIQYRGPDGRRHQERFGSKKDAEARKAQVTIDIINGNWVDPKAPKVEEDQGPTFGEFVERFKREYGSLRRSVYYQEIYRAAVEFYEGRLLREITPTDLDAFHRHCLTGEGKVSASTTKKRLTALGTLFKNAQRWGVLKTNPSEGLQKPKEPKHKDRYLTRDEWDRLYAASPEWLKPILLIAVATSLRLKEVVGLRWDDVDRDNALIYVRADNKTGAPKVVHITLSVQQVLDGQRFRQHLRSPYVFVDADGLNYTSPLRRNRISKWTRTVAKDSGLEEVNFKALRHTAASWMAQSGHSAIEIAKVLGHATTQMTARYTHLGPEHTRTAAESINRQLLGSDSASSAEAK